MTAKKPKRKAAKKRAVKKATQPAPEVKEDMPLAEKVRRMEVRNILAKLNAGKTLTARENQILQDHTNSEKAKDKSKKKPTLKELAAHLGCSGSTLTRFLRDHPDAPRENLEAMKFYYDTLRGQEQGRATESVGEVNYRKNKAQADKTEFEAALAKKKLEILNGGYAKITDIEPLVSELASQVVDLLRQHFEQEAPTQYPGKTTAECRDENQNRIDLICRKVQEGISKVMTESERATIENVSNEERSGTVRHGVLAPGRKQEAGSTRSVKKRKQ